MLPVHSKISLFPKDIPLRRSHPHIISHLHHRTHREASILAVAALRASHKGRDPPRLWLLSGVGKLSMGISLEPIASGTLVVLW